MIKERNKIARVFMRKTKATPDDKLTFIRGIPRKTDLSDVKEIHVSVVFTWDMENGYKTAERLAKLGIPVVLGGVAFGDRTTEFKPGLYVKPEFIKCSVGCHNKCWFCEVWKREPEFRELPILEGYNEISDNFLMNSKERREKVYTMLAARKEKPKFTGGLEAKILTPWDAEQLRNLKPQRLYFAYDTPDDYEPLVEAGKMLLTAGFTKTSHVMASYVLIGYQGDTFEKAERRMIETMKAGFVPFAMLYRDKEGKVNEEWRKFQREWTRPIIVGGKCKEYFKTEDKRK